MSVKRNTLWNLAGTGLPLLVAAVTVPYLIRASGIEAFGILTLVWGLIGYFSLFDLGLGRALTQRVATARAAGDKERLPGLIKSGISFIALTGCAGALLLALLAAPLAESWLNVSADLQNETRVALLIASAGIPLATITSGFRGVLEAFEDFRRVNLLRIILGTANFGLPAVTVLLISESLVWMVASLVFARLYVLVAHIRLARKWVKLDWVGRAYNKDDLKQLISFGAWMSVSNIISPLMVTADRFVISSVLGASVVAYYTVPLEALIRVLIIPNALAAALFPRISVLFVQNILDVRRLYKRSLIITFLTMLPLCALIASLSRWGLSTWIDHDFADRSWSIVSILSLGIFFNGLATIPFAAIQASGDARLTAALHMIELVVYVPTLIILLNLFGLAGAATAWTFRVAIDFFALLLFARSKGI